MQDVLDLGAVVLEVEPAIPDVHHVVGVVQPGGSARRRRARTGSSGIRSWPTRRFCMRHDELYVADLVDSRWRWLIPIALTRWR